MLQSLNIKGNIPFLLLYLPFLLAVAAPESIESNIAFGLGPFSFFLPLLLVIITAPFLFLFYPSKCQPLLASAGILFGFLGLGAGFMGQLPLAGMVYGAYIAMAFFLASKVTWDQGTLRLILIGNLGILVFLGAQIVLLSLGLTTILVDEGFTEIGRAGQISRIRTTAGPATGTSHLLFLIGAFTFITMLQFRCKLLTLSLFLTLVGTLIALTFSRGGLFMFFAFIGIFLFIRNKQLQANVIYKGLAVFIMVFSVAGLFFINDTLYQFLVGRGSIGNTLLGTTGRIMRFDEAYQYWSNNVIFGSGLGGYYSRAEWLRYLPGIGEGSTSPHNIYLLMLAESGIVGFLPFMLIMSLILIRSFKNANYITTWMLVVVFALGMNVELIYLETPSILIFCLMLSMALSFKGDRIVHYQSADIRR